MMYLQISRASYQDKSLDVLIFCVGLTVMKSKGSAYMLSQYEEEPESPGTLAEAITKTAEILTQKTGAVLSSANGGARYLRKIMMCGVGGRYKG